jgi:hypothetical protein
MFARRWNVLLSGRALATAAAIVLILGSACNKGIDSCDCPTYTFAVDARGAKVVPALPPGDTSARASATFNSATLAYAYSVLVAPSGTIDSIALLSP